MSQKLLKTLAIVLLALAMASVGWAFLSSNKRLKIQGPSALAVLPDQSVWVSVEDALWHLDSNGKRLAIVDGATLDVGGLIGNLVVHPNGQLVASVRDDPTLYFLDSATAKIRSRLIPQWPSDLRQHGSRAITYVFHPDGRVAVSTGGGHAVAVFDTSGQLLARSKPGLYEFTNGLWWAGDSLWTTNTNGMALLQLDGRTLELKSRVQLLQHQNGWKYLGMAVASHGTTPSAAEQDAPLVTLVRFANGMVEGHATDVFSNGMQSDYPISATVEPRDVKWNGDELLMVDGASYAIKRYSNARTSLPDFGDEQVRTELAASLLRRNSLQMQYNAGLVGAMVLFFMGFAAALGAQRLEKKQALVALGVDLSQLGAPRLSRLALQTVFVRVFWLPFAVFGVVALLSIGLRRFPVIAKATGVPVLPGVVALFLTAFVLLLTAFFLLHRSFRRGMADPDAEAVFNYQAVKILESEPAYWRLRQPGELPRETLMLSSPLAGLRWVVLTNLRLLVFVSNLKDRTLLTGYPRREIVNLRLLGQKDMTWSQRWQVLSSFGSAILRFEFKDGTTLEGRTMAKLTAQRMAALLRGAAFQAPAISEMDRAQLEQAQPHAAASLDQRAIRQTLASFLLPGFGQRMQGRKGTALHYFFVWLIVLVFLVAPVVWTLWAPRAAVPALYSLLAAGAYVFTCSLAALDVWRMRTRRV